MQKNKAIIYIDPSGKEHDALVTAINQMHDGVISLIYAVDDPENKGALNSTTIEVFDIPHMSAQSEVHTVPASGELGMRGVVVEQGNSDLPTYHIHCWKEAGEEHKALPEDHPAFDGKYAWPQADEHGKFPQVSRPAFEADQAAHQSGPVAQPDGSGDSIDDEPTVSELEERGKILSQLYDSQREVAKLTAQIAATPKPFGQIVAEIANSAQQETDVATQLDQAGQAPSEPQGEADPPIA